MRHRSVAGANALLITLAATSAAQTGIPIRDLTTIEATSAEIVGFVNGVRELSDGRVLVNDAGKRRLLMFDRLLSTARVVADTVAGSKVQYGPRATGIIPYAGDSTLLVDLAGRAF